MSAILQIVRPHQSGKETLRITPRQRQIITLIAEGYVHKEIARELHLAEKTITTHAQNINEKLSLMLNKHCTHLDCVYFALANNYVDTEKILSEYRIDSE